MNRHFAKEIRPLLLPWLVAAIEGLLPPGDSDPVNVFATALSFCGFVLTVSMAYAIEFQERTLPLLLSQPIERFQLWRDKLSITALATLTLLCLNWRAHALLAGFPVLDLGLFFGWLLLCATICSAGFWIVSVRSVLGGVVVAFLVQLVVLTGLCVATKWLGGPTLAAPDTEFITSISVSGLIYCAAFLWLSREFWKTDMLEKAGLATLVIVLFGLGELASAGSGQSTGNLLETCLVGMFVLATICSTGWWTLVARTALGGAVLAAASQYLSVLAIAILVSWVSGAESPEDNRVLLTIFLGAALYSALFLWRGWRRFSRLELRDVTDAEGAVAASRSPDASRRLGWLRCRPGESWLNLLRKELRLQKPLAMLAAIFAACWTAWFGLQCLKPHNAYTDVGTVLICLYAPLALVLAGSMSIGEERFLGVSAWHLTLPISARRQCLVKLLVGAITGIALGLVLPFAFELLAALTTKTGFLASTNWDPGAWLALSAISGSLFVLGFWAATWMPTTIRAAITAVVGLVPLFSCGAFGTSCARQMCGFPLTALVIPGVQSAPKMAEVIGACGFVVVFVSIALIQSLAQFRRVRIPISTVITHSLVLAGSVALGAFWWTSVLISAGH